MNARVYTYIYIVKRPLLKAIIGPISSQVVPLLAALVVGSPLVGGVPSWAWVSGGGLLG